MKPGKGFLIGSYLAFSLSILSKESGAMILPVFLVYDLIYKRKEKLPARYSPLIAVFIFYLVLRVRALHGLTVPVAFGMGQIKLEGMDYIVNIFPIFALYIWKLFLPVNLNPYYLFHVKSLAEPAALVSLPVSAGFAAAVWFSWKKNKTVFFPLSISRESPAIRSRRDISICPL